MPQLACTPRSEDVEQPRRSEDPSGSACLLGSAARMNISDAKSLCCLGNRVPGPWLSLASHELTWHRDPEMLSTPSAAPAIRMRTCGTSLRRSCKRQLPLKISNRVCETMQILAGRVSHLRSPFGCLARRWASMVRIWMAHQDGYQTAGKSRRSLHEIQDLRCAPWEARPGPRHARFARDGPATHSLAWGTSRAFGCGRSAEETERLPRW